jgi:hypothetical protein
VSVRIPKLPESGQNFVDLVLTLWAMNDPFALQQTANLFAMPPGRGRRHRHRRAGAHLATPDIGSVLESLDLW